MTSMQLVLWNKIPGINCAKVACLTFCRTKGIDIFKLPGAKNDENKEITKTMVIDQAFKEKILNDSVHRCEKHFKAEASSC